MKFSITIPSYKRRYLHETIESVMSQTYQDWELIIVDDCSPEDIHGTVERYMETDNRIKYYRNPKNCGVLHLVDNWNICLSYCTGDYVICIGDDDRFLPCSLEEYSRLITQHPGLNVYHTRTQIIDENGDVRDTLEERPEYETAVEMMTSQWKNDRRQFIGDFLFSRQWLDDNKGYVNFPNAYSSDWATANLAAMEKGIANTNVSGFQYRDNAYSISQSQDLKQAISACLTAWQWYEKILADKSLPLLNTMNAYFSRKMTDMIYLDVKHQPTLKNIKYWHSQSLNLSKGTVLATSLRAVISKLLH